MVVFSYTQEFRKQAKRLAKNYRSLADDLEAFVNELFQNPNMGKDLGNGVRKIRMAVKKCFVSIDFQQNITDFWRKFETQYSTSVKNIFYLCTVIAG